MSKKALANLVHCKQELKCKECKYKSRCTMERDYNNIKQDLDRLERLEKVFSDLKSMFEIKIGIDMGNEYFIKIKQLDTIISELIPIEDIEIFKEWLENERY